MEISFELLFRLYLYKVLLNILSVLIGCFDDFLESFGIVNSTVPKIVGIIYCLWNRIDYRSVCGDSVTLRYNGSWAVHRQTDGNTAATQQLPTLQNFCKLCLFESNVMFVYNYNKRYLYAMCIPFKNIYLKYDEPATLHNTRK